MLLTKLTLISLIILLLSYAIYNEFILEQRKGKTLLKIPLLRRHRIDGLIFSGLVFIVLWQNIHNSGSILNSWLLTALTILALYLSWLRQPKILFKQQGFFFNSQWVAYPQIQSIQLSQDGVLVMGLEKRQLFIRVRCIDDLERIYKLLVTMQ